MDVKKFCHLDFGGFICYLNFEIWVFAKIYRDVIYRKDGPMKKYTSLERINKELKQIYEQNAKDYDKHRDNISSTTFYNKLIPDFLHQIIPNNPEGIILDVAAGTGRATFALSDRAKQVIGVDIAENMMKNAKQKIKMYGVKNVCFQVATANKLPFKDNCFDVVTALMFFHLIPNNMYKPIIDEFIRVLKPHGIVVLEFASPFHGIIIGLFRQLFIKKKNFLMPYQIKKLFSYNTYSITKRGTYLPGTYLISRINYKLSEILLSLCKYFPFYYLCNELFIIAKKKGD